MARDTRGRASGAIVLAALAIVLVSLGALGGLLRPVGENSDLLVAVAVALAAVLGALTAYLAGRSLQSRGAERDAETHLRVLEGLDAVDRAIRGAADLETMMTDALDVSLEVLGSDRAWLLFPADPEAPSWRVPMERTRPEFPGAFAADAEIPMLPEAANVFREALELGEPLVFDPTTDRELPPESSEQFGILSQMVVSVRPATGQPWLFGVHQCTHARVWSSGDIRLLTEIGRRLGDSLNSLLYLNDLKARTAALEEAERELTQHQEHLEVLVDERTRQLHETTKELIAASTAKDAFLAGMSHELRTPLNSIIGFAGVMEQGLAGDLNAEQSRQVGMISNAGQRLLKLVNDLLDLSKIESGAVRLELAAMDPLRTARECLDEIRPIAEGKGLTVALEAPDPVPQIVSDDARVHEVLGNLLSNAVAFTNAGTVRLRLRAEEGGIAFEVFDTGRGIATVDRERVFEEYYQVAEKTEAKPAGTGLGLALAQRLAQLLGGSISLESEPGHGSTFTLHLPHEATPVERSSP